METKEFVEKCFANFDNVPEEFKNKLMEDLDKVMKKIILEKLLKEDKND